jgi:hypothetical protein
MKAHTRIRRAVRSLALAGCLGAALAVPTVAGATQINGGGGAPATTYHPHGRPAAVAVSAGHYSLPSGFRTDAQTKPPAVTTVPAVQASAATRLTSDSDHTLAIVLASTALGVALCGTAFAAFRVTRIQRRLAGSNS